MVPTRQVKYKNSLSIHLFNLFTLPVFQITVFSSAICFPVVPKVYSSITMNCQILCLYKETTKITLQLETLWWAWCPSFKVTLFYRKVFFRNFIGVWTFCVWEYHDTTSSLFSTVTRFVKRVPKYQPTV